MKKLLLISNKVFHYRVSIYNYFARNFKEYGWEFIVRSNELQKDNPYHIQFDFKEIPFNFFIYKKEIEDINPDVVIIFLHLKDIIMWSLIHWLKIKKIPIVYWNHGINLQDPQNKLKYFLFNYLHTLSNAIILYSENEMKYMAKKFHQFADLNIVILAENKGKPVGFAFGLPNYNEVIKSNPDNFINADLGFSLFERAWTLAGMENILMYMIL